MTALNPHNDMIAISPPGPAQMRVWRCTYCGDEGTFAQLTSKACSYVYEPCESCGQTPTCARDCRDGRSWASVMAAPEPPPVDVNRVLANGCNWLATKLDGPTGYPWYVAALDELAGWFTRRACDADKRRWPR